MPNEKKIIMQAISQKLDNLISKYSMQKHPEGGFFAETFRSETSLISPMNSESRSALTDIYYMLKKDEISRFHKVIHDEIWNFYEGSPLKLFKYDGKKVSEYMIGPNCNDGYKVVIEGGSYQAAISTGDYSLVGCTVAPGFDFADFSFLEDDAKLAEGIMINFPKYTYLI